jgi:hypothetical protein
LKNSDIPRYTSLRVLKRVLIRHTQADQKFERTRKQNASREKKELATEVTSKKLCRRVWLATSVD